MRYPWYTDPKLQHSGREKKRQLNTYVLIRNIANIAITSFCEQIRYVRSPSWLAFLQNKCTQICPYSIPFVNATTRLSFLFISCTPLYDTGASPAVESQLVKSSTSFTLTIRPTNKKYASHTLLTANYDQAHLCKSIIWNYIWTKRLNCWDCCTGLSEAN